MNKTVLEYFTAEQNESLLFLFVALFATAVSIYFLFQVKTDFTRGISYSLLAIASIQFVVCFTVYFRSPMDITRVQNYLDSEPAKISEVEIPRMKTVMKSFVLYRYIEIFCAIVGLGLFFYFPNGSVLKGIGLGLFVQAVLMLGFDFFAERRGKEYLEFLLGLKIS